MTFRGLKRALEPAPDAEPDDGERLLKAFAQRGGRTRMRALQFIGEGLEALQRGRVIVERPRLAQPPAHEWAIALW